ncbi:hypothetical protein PHYBLDRAFT_153544 [Phycomyces blakesleeanus NRRL 1555(-)]|uniref:Uncharacterized protein n=1 Tax=Phycomyces blakesleeanus (strain ATCC 8743b / DSM 1359 / FGSC 10004 / NBRC 33097 / NRRL 1555) TaxID=763407 RepID=A0A163CSI8_PHYB8|nr:hypothetical protein PHYBLDRAFT_153544 [Phycomyces blakesleeanus NRRL 1555(-)]OAD65300.1 hypothetical protein PHYBLDRAFT_153544 [Phycomyces blakesleeanus NRRL 1555(-)]|eukprot:XP_018283340.1 hypothetical protein PHYBLDRAFT_153544 [Phycomyces blakesleeanus NRRL 1555(-)]
MFLDLQFCLLPFTVPTFYTAAKWRAAKKATHAISQVLQLLYNDILPATDQFIYLGVPCANKGISSKSIATHRRSGTLVTMVTLNSVGACRSGFSLLPSSQLGHVASSTTVLKYICNLPMPPISFTPSSFYLFFTCLLGKNQSSVKSPFNTQTSKPYCTLFEQLPQSDHDQIHHIDFAITSLSLSSQESRPPYWISLLTILWHIDVICNADSDYSHETEHAAKWRADSAIEATETISADSNNFSFLQSQMSTLLPSSVMQGMLPNLASFLGNMQAQSISQLASQGNCPIATNAPTSTAPSTPKKPDTEASTWATTAAAAHNSIVVSTVLSVCKHYG